MQAKGIRLAVSRLGSWLGAEGWPWRKIALAVIVVLFVWFVWPTPYRDVGRLMQVNRLTGAMCRVGQSCW
jgi:hypothetical protein